jgi:HAMP domain-containing protein
MSTGEAAYLATVVIAFLIFAGALAYEMWRNER